MLSFSSPRVDHANGGVWFQQNGTADHFAMNLMFDGARLPAISVKTPLTTSEVVPPFSANSASSTYTMTSYPAPDGPASGSLSANLGKRVELTDFVILNPGILDADRVNTHGTGSNGAVDYVASFTLVAGKNQ